MSMLETEGNRHGMDHPPPAPNCGIANVPLLERVSARTAWSRGAGPSCFQPRTQNQSLQLLSSLRFEWPQLCFPQSDARILTTKPLGWGLGRDGENKTSQDTGHWQNGMVRWSLGQSLSSTARPCSLISVVSVIRPRENPAPSADWLLYRNAKIIPVEFQRHFLNFFF